MVSVLLLPLPWGLRDSLHSRQGPTQVWGTKILQPQQTCNNETSWAAKLCEFATEASRRSDRKQQCVEMWCAPATQAINPIREYTVVISRWGSKSHQLYTQNIINTQSSFLAMDIPLSINALFTIYTSHLLITIEIYISISFVAFYEPQGIVIEFL